MKIYLGNDIAIGQHAGISNGVQMGGGGGAVLPPDAIGVWYAADYDATGHPRLPNSLSVNANSLNLLAGAGSRRILSQAPWATTNATTTDGATGPDGKAEAARILQAGSFNWSHATPVTLLATTYTIAAYVKSNTGSSQDFRMSISGSFSSPKTATTSWQRFTHTGTVSAGTGDVSGIRTVSGGSTADFLFCDVELYLGSSDLGPQVYTSGDIYLGRNAYDTNITYASGRIAVANNISYGLLLLPGDASTWTAFTAIVVGRQVGAGVDGMFFAKLPASAANDLRFYISKTNGNGIVVPTIQWNGTLFDYGDGALWSLNGKGDHFIAHRWDGSTYSTWLDDSELYNNALSSPTNPSVHTLRVTSAIAGWYEIDALALWNRSLTDTEVRAAYAVMKARVALASITVAATPTRILVTEGDSLTYAANGYVYQAVLDPAVLGNNVAITGSNLSIMSARAASLVYPAIPLNKAGRQYVLSIFIGQNDMPADTTQYAADLATYIAGARAAGYDKIVLCTLLTRKDGGAFTGHAAKRNAINAIITGVGWAAANGVDALADFAADPTMGPDDAPDNATYWLGDKVHPTTAGYLILAGIWEDAVNGL